MEGKRRGRDMQIRGQFGRRVSLRTAPDEQAEDGKPGFGSQRTERIQGLSCFHLSNLMELCAGRQASDRIGGGIMVERESTTYGDFYAAKGAKRAQEPHTATLGRTSGSSATRQQ